MKIIGLTGGIGSGKSTVASILKELGATLIDSDKVGHEVLNPDTPGWHEVVEAFGQQVLSPNDTIDRRKLAHIVFNNPETLKQLNHIVHPKIEKEVISRLAELRERKTDTVVIEAALIMETGWVKMADRIWLVKTPKDLTLQRLKERGMSESESLVRMASQYPPEERIKHGLVIINNNGSLEELRATVVKLWNERHNEDKEQFKN